MPNKKKHAKHKRAVRLRRALPSPIKRLPLELLQEIFVHCLPSSRNHVLNKKKAPLLLTYICPEWREIATSTPELWSSLDIEIPWRILSAAPKAAPLHYYIQKAKAWLARSGTRPLFISLGTREPRMYDSLVELLGPFMYRVQVLDLWVNHDFMTRLGPQEVPLLQDVAVHAGSSTTIPPFDVSIFSSWTQTSSVRRLHLDEHVHCGHASGLSLDQLQELELNCIYDANEILNLLKQCRNLEQFSLSTIIEPIDVEMADELVTLPNLQTLNMTTLSFTVEALLFRLILPKLRNLIINVSPMEDLASDQDLNSTLSTMITRSSCALSMERFRFPHVAPFDTLVDLIFLMPNLVDLALRGFYTSPTDHSFDNHVGDRFLQRLTPTSTDTPSSCLLPNLRKIRLFDYRYIGDDTVTDFVYWRMRSFRRGIPQLTAVHIQRWEVYPRVILREIEFWEDRGMDITVESRRLRRPPIYLPP